MDTDEAVTSGRSLVSLRAAAVMRSPVGTKAAKDVVLTEVSTWEGCEEECLVWHFGDSSSEVHTEGSPGRERVRWSLDQKPVL